MIEDNSAASYRTWLRYAFEDLVVASQTGIVSQILPRHACFHAQQAAEKAIKAALVYEGAEVPRIHDLNRLADMLPPGWQLGVTAEELYRLTLWIPESRYPGDWTPPTDDDAQHALEQARIVVDTIAARLNEEPPNT